jgi:hypothetical protein
MHRFQTLVALLAIFPFSVLSYRTELDDLDLFLRDLDLEERGPELNLEVREAESEPELHNRIEIRNADPYYGIAKLLKSGKLKPAKAARGISGGVQHFHRQPRPSRMERRDQFADPEIFICNAIVRRKPQTTVSRKGGE